jgi:hypothetical protein
MREATTVLNTWKKYRRSMMVSSCWLLFWWRSNALRRGMKMNRKTFAPRITITLMVFRPTISRMGARETGKRKCLPLTAAMRAVAIITSTKL